MRADARALINRRQKGAAISLRAAERERRADRDEARQVFIFGAQAVEHPGAHARAHELGAAGMQLHESLGMIRDIRVHAAQHAQVIRMVGDLREQLGNPEAALARAGRI